MTGNAPALPLQSINENGSAPETRLADAPSALEIFTKMLNADVLRNNTRAKLRGLVDGNPPYNPVELRKNAQAYRTNVNFRESEAFLTLAMSSFYDVFAEVPTYAVVKTNYGNDQDKREEWSKIITEEFDRLQKTDQDFDYLMQLSQREMVLIGTGPMVFDDPINWKCKAVMATDLLVPDGTKSNVSDWKVAIIRDKPGVDDLFRKIEDPEAATKAGWDVEWVRRRIRAAMPEPYRSGIQYNWEFFQQQLRSNDVTYSARCDVITIAHIFYKEFDGRISHAIIDERDASKFLYRRLNRFKRWEEVIHPMYYDRGDGTHHGVKGLGIKMLATMELKNRLRCSTVDAAFARTQILFKPLNANALTKTNVVQQGPYAILPHDYDVVQQNVAGVLDAPMAVNSDLENVLQGNLSQYRQTLVKPEGNPRTATEIQATISQQSALGKTQLSRYYAQLDAFFAERFRRAANPNLTDSSPGGKEALEFQRRCKERGVPAMALYKLDLVQATRTVGQGSQYAKQQLLGGMLGLAPMLPEIGRVNLYQDYIAAQVGQQMVQRYMPDQQQSAKAQDQVSYAMMEHNSMRLGNPVTVTDTQNQGIHIAVHLEAADAAAGSIEQGGNPQDILLFLTAVDAHVREHLQRLSADPTRQAEIKQFVEHLNQLGQVIQQLGQMVQEQAQQAAIQQQAQAVQQGADPETQLQAALMQSQIQRENAIALAEIQRDNAKAQADANRKNAKVTADIRRQNAMAAANANSALK